MKPNIRKAHCNYHLFGTKIELMCIMRKLLYILSLFAISKAFGQQPILYTTSNNQHEVIFTFSDDCEPVEINEIQMYILPKVSEPDFNNSLSKSDKKGKEVKYELINNERVLVLEDLPIGEYTVFYTLKDSLHYSNLKEDIVIEPQTDKIIIYIPKLRLKVSRKEEDQNSKENYQNYYWCNEKCTGYFISYYSDKSKKTEGNFISGKPLLLIEHNKFNDGKTISTYNENWKPLKVETYNEDGLLSETKKYKYKKRHIILKIFNGNGKLIEKEKFDRY